MPKPLTVGITINCGKFWKRWEYQTTWPASWETCIQVRKQQWELAMEQLPGSKRQGCVLSPCLFNLYAEYIMRNSGLEKAQARIKIAGINIKSFRYADAMIFIFWMLSFKPTFSLSSFTFRKRLFNSLLSTIRVVSSAYLKLLILLPAIWFLLMLHPAQNFSWCTLHVS